ncbi:MAG: hypothetical protein E6Q90_03455 [Actinobacteria bacterium]|nr:MAG: hypothetical protein E6Q90_03455 [Actinomycetota bacterium]
MKRLVAIGLAGTAAATVLVGCEKPNPGVTMWSGTHSTRAQALCWADDANQSVDAQKCAEAAVQAAAGGNGAPSLPVINGSTLGVSVDKVLTDDGWFLAQGGQQATDTITGTYFRTTINQVPAAGMLLEVRALAADGKNTRGVWVFKLTGQQS